LILKSDRLTHAIHAHVWGKVSNAREINTSASSRIAKRPRTAS